MITIVPDSIIPEICEGDLNGFFSIEIGGGTLPYSVSLDDPSGPYTTGEPTQTVFDFENLNGGDHIVYVRDSAGCESEWNITFPGSVFLEPVAEVQVLCSDNDPVSQVVVTVDETLVDIAELTYSLNGGPYQVSNIFDNVPAGTNYYVTVRHTNGCTQLTEFFDIGTPSPVWLTLEEGDVNQIVATPFGGNGEYTFTLNGVDYGSTNIFTITESGTYVVVVTDSNGCSAIAEIVMEFSDICIPNYFTPNGDGVNDGWTIGCADNYPNLKFSIYDRYGRKVATLNAGEKWDGTYGGEELPAGDYWYIVETNREDDNRDFVGHFTLYR